MTRPPVCVLAALWLGLAAAWPVAADTPAPDAGAQGERFRSVEELLEQVRSGRLRESREQAERIARFRAARDQRKRLLAEAGARRKALEAEARRLEQAFEDNERALSELRQRLDQRLGGLKELFGVVQQVAGDTRAQLAASPVSLHYPDRVAFLAGLAERMGSTTRLPELGAFERLWYELEREMAEQGRVVRFTAPVVGTDGMPRDREVVRVGVFDVVADGRYLQYVPESGRLVALARQPGRRFTAAARALQQATEGVRPFALDPTRGQLLALLVQTPTLRERIDQGGVIGYIILGLGALALVVALWRLLVLAWTARRVRVQLRHPARPRSDNPLGRVLAVHDAARGADPETLELKLDEAILAETPRLERGHTLLRVISVVAPLLGLLGTVTGMIITFQAITLFGAGDPKVMAGGISQALVTTVQGLAVAVPTVLLYAWVSSRARALKEVLEVQAAGLLARQVEASSAPGGAEG